MTDFPAVVYIKASRLDNSAPKLEDVSELNVVNPKKKIKGSKLFTVEKDNESLKCLRPQCPKEKRFSEAVLQLNSASEKESVLLKDQTDL
ncbi:uncharacterized protein TNCV_1538621 [Trichonephila clavipes]|nr:uncharacterized protein TNCV_1538621 [Trichonephila clavipes]